MSVPVDRQDRGCLPDRKPLRPRSLNELFPEP